MRQSLAAASGTYLDFRASSRRDLGLRPSNRPSSDIRACSARLQMRREAEVGLQSCSCSRCPGFASRPATSVLDWGLRHNATIRAKKNVQRLGFISGIITVRVAEILGRRGRFRGTVGVLGHRLSPRYWPSVEGSRRILGHRQGDTKAKALARTTHIFASRCLLIKSGFRAHFVLWVLHLRNHRAPRFRYTALPSAKQLCHWDVNR